MSAIAQQFVGITHPFAPVCDERSKLLILGTFPSVKSRENAFYYGHPQNRFWRVMAAVLDEPVPAAIDEKLAMLLKHRVAVWDVLASCDIEGSADGSIKRPVPNDIAGLLARGGVESVFANGQTAAKLYRRYCEPLTGLTATTLPSTSPANASWSVERLSAEWRARLLPQLQDD